VWSESEIVTLIESLWRHDVAGRHARCIARHESSLDPMARNAKSGASGLFQLMPFWWNGNNEHGWKFDPYDAQKNAEHAHLIWEAQRWEPWTTERFCSWIS
jgi:soluble lytic murein transglycosylase-like protein